MRWQNNLHRFASGKEGVISKPQNEHNSNRKAITMRWLKYVIGVFCLAITGCSLLKSSSGIKAEPVQFFYADEYRQGQGFAVLADRRIFTVMAFLNATGYDEEVQGQQMHPVRVRVRKMVADSLKDKPEKLAAWRQYYKTSGLATFHYQDFVLSLCADYPFRRIRRDNELGYQWTAGRLRDFPDVLNDFWVTAKLANVWSEIKSDYVAEINKYDMEKMGRQMSFLWEYLRMSRQDAFVIVNVPDLINCHYHAIGAKYENYYYCVESPGSHSYDLDIHEYLHSVVNRIVETNYSKYSTKLQDYYSAGKTGPMSKTYQQPVTFASECLVRALDDRLHVLLANDPAVTKRLEGRVADLTRDGLMLTQPFYLLLKEYENSTLNFEEFIPVMFRQVPEYKN